jgi:hypothetical protein
MKVYMAQLSGALIASGAIGSVVDPSFVFLMVLGGIAGFIAHNLD